MKEIWKEIPRYIQCEVSNLGHVRYKENVHIHGLAKRVRPSNVGDRRFFYPGELWLIKKLLAAKVPYITIGKMFKCSTFLVQEIKKGKKDTHLRGIDGNVMWEVS